MGASAAFFLFKTNQLKRVGSTVNEIATVQRMPITEMSAMDLMAGWVANIKTPTPMMVVTAESKMEIVNEGRCFFPVLYSLSKPSEMNMA